MISFRDPHSTKPLATSAPAQRSALHGDHCVRIIPSFCDTRAFPPFYVARFFCAILFVRAGLVNFNGEAKRHIAAGALRVNDAVVSDENAALSASDVVDGAIKLSLGKKKHALLKPS